jgi:YVTN family beta-propeller protein
VTNVPNPVFLTYDSANGNIYAANHDTQFVSVIDSSTNSVTKTITVGPDPTGVGFDADNGIVYVGNQGANYVSLINGTNNMVIGNVTVGQGPVTPVYDPVHRNVYVTNFNSNEAPGNTVSVISTRPPTPPNTMITSAIDGNNNPVQNAGSTSSNKITFQLTSSGGTPPITFQCSLDNSAFSNCASTLTYTNLASGQHTAQFRATDSTALQGPSVSFTWQVTAAAPPSDSSCISTRPSRIIMGTNGDDTLIGSSGADIINGRGGNDGINGCNGADIINGGNGDDRIAGSQGNDMLYGDAGNDLIQGDSGNDQIFGGNGNDILTGGAGRDQFNCGAGTDTITDFQPGVDTKAGNCE